MALAIPHLGPRARKALRITGFVLVGLVTFVFALQLTFPYGRVRAKIVELLSDKYDVQIDEDVERGIMPARFYLKHVTLRTRTTKADEVPTTFYIERLELDVGLLALIRQRIDVDFDAKIGVGHLSGTVKASKDHVALDLKGSDLPSGNLPMRDLVGVPTSGKVDFSASIDLPVQRAEKSRSGGRGLDFEKAAGYFELKCPAGCAVGDGKTKLKLKPKNSRSAAFAEGGIEFGPVNIDSLTARLELKDGKLEMTKWDAKSSDGELHVEFIMAMNNEINESLVTGCLRFQPSEVLNKREPRTYAAISTTGAPRGPDGLFNIKLDGRFKDVKRLAQPCGPAVNTSMDNPGGTPPRPSITIQPESEVRPPANPPPPPMPAVPPGVANDAGVHAPDESGAHGSAGSAGSAGSGSAGSAQPAALEGTMTAPPPPQGEPAAGEGTAGAGNPPR